MPDKVYHRGVHNRQNFAQLLVSKKLALSSSSSVVDYKAEIMKNIANFQIFLHFEKMEKQGSVQHSSESRRVWEAFEVLGEQVEFMYLPRIC